MPRTPAAGAAAADCRAEIRLRYHGLRLESHEDVLMFCLMREHPISPCAFNTNDVRLVGEHFRQNPHHHCGTVKLNRCNIRYAGETAQSSEMEQHVFIGPDPSLLRRSLRVGR